MGALSVVLTIFSLMSFLDSINVIEGAGIGRLKGAREWRIQDISCTTAGYFGYPGDCMRFYRCVDYFGTNERFSLFVFDCPEGTIFDDTVSVCNHPAWLSPHARCHTGFVDEESSDEESSGEDIDEEDGSGYFPTSTSTVRPPTTSAPRPEEIPTTSTSLTTQVPNIPKPTTTIPPIPETTTILPTSESPTTVATTTISTITEVATEVSEAVTIPDVVTSTLEAVTSTPEEVASIPEAVTTIPEAVTTIPEAVTINPETVTSIPEAVTTIPELVTAISESITSIPETVTGTPDSTESGSSESGSTEPGPTESGSTESSYTSETSTNFVDITTVVPDTTTLESLSTEIPDLSTEVTSGFSTETPGSSVEATTTAPIASASQFTLKCGDSMFHRHPLKCELFYECVWNGLTFNINVLPCQPGLVFDEASSSCMLPDQTDECQPLQTPPSVTTPTSESQYSQAPDSQYNCTAPGHFPYELDCIRFYRCFEVSPNVLKGLLYRCPDGYQFSTMTDRCEMETPMSDCDRIANRFDDQTTELESAIVVRVDDLEEFFSSVSFYYDPTRQ